MASLTIDLTDLLTKVGCTQALIDVARERVRQVKEEGWHRDHDDEHDAGEIAAAAACYALNASCLVHPFNATSMDFETAQQHGWPWSEPAWKPKDARRDLVRSAALILAEIERIDRAAG
jgi:hypothetical protein